MTRAAPHYSIIIPVLGEADSIQAVIDHIRCLEQQEKAEILVVDGDPEGKTLQAIVRQDVHKILSLRGRGRQMNEGAKKARGEILLFLHADTFLPTDALSLIDDALRHPRMVGGAFDLGFRSA
ncbi:MAG: glycosyltransferase, partial [Syntrophaceae bacterium]|nr:glycosyltransferase [Syntrophaceae bacterium]